MYVRFVRSYWRGWVGGRQAPIMFWDVGKHLMFIYTAIGEEICTLQSELGSYIVNLVCCIRFKSQIYDRPTFWSVSRIYWTPTVAILPPWYQGVCTCLRCNFNCIFILAQVLQEGIYHIVLTPGDFKFIIGLIWPVSCAMAGAAVLPIALA